MKSVSEQLAQTAIDFSATEFSKLPEDVVFQAKLCLLDTLAVTIGGFGAPVSNIICDWVREIGGKNEATVIGNGLMVPASHAALANGTMLRYLDYMDSYGGDSKGGWHGSETISALLAIGELVHATGQDILRGIVLGYELGARLCDVAGETSSSIGPKGVHHGTLGYITTPAIVGPLLKMSPEQIANAIGSSGSLVTLGILDAMPAEPNTMAKNLAFPLGSYIGITATLWAKKGFTGPHRVFEGRKGLVSSVFGKEYDLDTLRKFLILPWKRYAILETLRKMFPVESSALGSVEAVHKLIIKHDIGWEEIQEINIQASERCAFHNGDPQGFYSINKESADHSLPFAVSMVALEREIGPDQYTIQKLKDPRISRIAKTINLVGKSTKSDKAGAAYVQIKTKNRGTFSTSVEYRKGHPLNPMGDDDIKEKFLKMAKRFISKAKANEAIDLVYDLEHQSDICDLMKHLVF